MCTSTPMNINISISNKGCPALLVELCGIAVLLYSLLFGNNTDLWYSNSWTILDTNQFCEVERRYVFHTRKCQLNWTAVRTVLPICCHARKGLGVHSLAMPVSPRVFSMSFDLLPEVCCTRGETGSARIPGGLPVVTSSRWYGYHKRSAGQSHTQWVEKVDEDTRWDFDLY